MNRYIRASELFSRPGRSGRWPVSVTTGWRWVQAGLLPAPVHLGPGVTAWPMEVIERYEAAAAADMTDPGNAVKAAAASVAARRLKRQNAGGNHE